MKIGFLASLIFLGFGLQAVAQTGKIVCTVVDENGETMPGVSIYIQGEAKNNSTNIDGKFIYPIEAGIYTLVIKFVSYQEKTITGIIVNKNETTTISISLTPHDESALSQNAFLITYHPDGNSTKDLEKKKSLAINETIIHTSLKKSPNTSTNDALYNMINTPSWLSLVKYFNFYDFE